MESGTYKEGIVAISYYLWKYYDCCYVIGIIIIDIPLMIVETHCNQHLYDF